MKTQPKYVCIHGHFYQPPRENPWLEAIELQESAEPFHDWNERITSECYMPNSAARIQSNDGHIVGIINNYARMSFNFGPTLLSWMDTHSPITYKAILEADKESIERFGGHGSAMAQVYNHIIMPLANQRDKNTQIIWGLVDFEKRFGRKPEGMWLAEAAVDTATLELLAEHDIKFTILAPNQAKAVRPIAANGHEVPEAGWEEVSGGRVDPARAYQCNLPSGRSIALFFYDGPISQAVAFEGILRSGETFAERLLSGFSKDRDYPQLLHIATDGETYGHHHKFGDMALAYALHYIEANNLAKLTNYGQFLELHPPAWEARIVEDSSWSCAHGVERWSADCGCSSGMHHGWSQKWRSPLRHALDWLRDTVNPEWEKESAKYFTDPWAARNAYIDVVLDRNPETVQHFISTQAKSALSQHDLSTALKLMEIQRQFMLMYTSCGWFFDELSGLETVQIMQYACRGIQLAEESLGLRLENDFINLVEVAKSNIQEHKDGAYIYENYVKPASVDLIRVGAQYAVMSLFEAESDKHKIYAFTVDRHDWQQFDAGMTRMVLGRARINSDVTYESTDATFCVLDLGGHNLTAGVRGPVDDAHFQDYSRQLVAAYDLADLPQVIRLIDQEFFGQTFSIKSLFKDERQAIINQIIHQSMEQSESALRLVFEQNNALMRFLKNVNTSQPKVLRSVGRFIICGELRQLLEENVPDPTRLMQIVDDAIALNIPLDGQGMELAINQAIHRQTQSLWVNYEDNHALQALNAIGALAYHLPFFVDFWEAQNIIFQLMDERYPRKKQQALAGDKQAEEWVKQYQELSSRLKVAIDD